LKRLKSSPRSPFASASSIRRIFSFQKDIMEGVDRNFSILVEQFLWCVATLYESPEKKVTSILFPNLTPFFFLFFFFFKKITNDTSTTNQQFLATLSSNSPPLLFGSSFFIFEKQVLESKNKRSSLHKNAQLQGTR